MPRHRDTHHHRAAAACVLAAAAVAALAGCEPSVLPCLENYDCTGAIDRWSGWQCERAYAFTCQPTCRRGACGDDGAPCTRNEDCREPEVVLVDACRRTPQGSEGCDDHEVCAMLNEGVRRCLPVCGTDRVCTGAQACLPDLDDPLILVCWIGGVVPAGEPCTDGHECASSFACNAAGFCSNYCFVGDGECERFGQVCLDNVCTPPGP